MTAKNCALSSNIYEKDINAIRDIARELAGEGVSLSAQNYKDATIQYITEMDAAIAQLEESLKEKPAPDDPVNLLFPVFRTPTDNKQSIGFHLKQKTNKFLTATFGAYETLLNKVASIAQSKFGKTPSEKEAAALKDFQSFANEVNKVFKRKNFGITHFPILQDTQIQGQAVATATELDLDLHRQLFTTNEKGEQVVPEQLKSALIIGAYQAMLDLANTPPRSKKHIAKLLNIEEEDVTPDIFNRYTNIGMSVNTAYNKWGQYVIQALAISNKTEVDYSPDMLAKLQTSLGGQVQQILRRVNAIQTNGIPLSTYLADSNQVSTNTGNSKFFYAIGPDKKASAAFTWKYENSVEANKGTNSIVARMFEIERDSQTVSLKPIKSVDTVTDTGQPVPTFLQKILKKAQSTPVFFKKDRVDLLKSLDSKDDNVGISLAQRIMGQKTPAQIQAMHWTERKPAESTNAGLQREWDAILDTEASLGEAIYNDGMYLKTSVWKMLRVGISSAINPTAYKIHRYLLKGKDWNTTVSFSDINRLNNFKLRIAEGFGLPTDKKSNETTLIKLEEFVGKHAAAIESMRVWVQGSGELNQDAVLALLDATELKGGERVKAFDALVAYAQHQKAIKDGSESFQTDIMGEVDGVANGPMLTLLMLGLSIGGQSMENLFAKGGFFTDQETKDFNVWRENPENVDLYLDVADKVSGTIVSGLRGDLGYGKKKNRMMTAEHKRYATAIWYFDGKGDVDGEMIFTDRSGIKGGVNPIMFGSGTQTAVKAMFGAFLESITKRIAKVNAMEEGELKVAAIEELKENLTILGFKDIEPATITQLQEEFFIDKRDKSRLWSMYYGETDTFVNDEGKKVTFTANPGIGAFVEQGIKDYFGPFLEKRQQMTKMSNDVANVYLAAKNALIDKAMKELGIEYNKEGIVVGLPQSKLDEIENTLVEAGLKPVMESYMGNLSQEPEAGMLLLDSGKQISANDAYVTQLTGSAPFNTGSPKKTTGHAEERTETGPGVLATSVGTHSTDSAISHNTEAILQAKGLSGFNIHDAKGTGLGGMLVMAQGLNKSTFESISQYSPLTALANMGMRSLKGYVDLSKDIALPAFNLESLKEIIDSAFEADKAKLQFLLKTKNINQYSFEGGFYKVTDKDRAELKKLWNKRQTEYKAQIAEFNELSKEVGAKKPSSTTVTPVAVDPVVEDVIATESQAEDEPNTNGVVEPTDVAEKPAADPKWEAAYDKARNKDGLALDELLSVIPDLDTVPVQYKLLSKLLKGTPVKIYVVKSSADVVNEQHREQLIKEAPAYAHYYDGSVYVYESQTSPSQLRTVLHESVHAVITNYLTGIIADVSAGRPVAPEALQSYNNLKELYELPEVQALKETYPDQMANLDEFITYGLTSKGFQTALKNIKTKKTEIATSNAFRDFFRAVAQMFKAAIGFKGKSLVSDNALYTLLAEGANIIEQAKTEQQAPTTQTTPTAPRAMALQNSGLYSHTTESLFDDLADPRMPLNGSVTNHLKSLLSGITNAIYGPYGTFKEAAMNNVRLDARDVFALAEANDAAPLAKAMHVGLGMSAQERFAADQVGMTIESALSQAKNYHFRRTLEKLYQQAQKEVTVAMLFDGDWALATATEKKQTQDLHDFIFNTQATNDQALIRFASLGLASQKVMDALGAVTTRFAPTQIKLIEKTMFKRLQEWFSALLNMFNKQVTGAFNGQTMDVRLEKLINKLVKNEVKRIDDMNKPNRLAWADAIGNAARVKTSTLTLQMAQSNFVRNNKFLPKIPLVGPTADAALRVAGRVAEASVQDQLTELGQAWLNTRNRAIAGTFGITAGIFNEILGDTNQNRKFRRLLQLVKKVETGREKTIEQTQNSINAAFADGGINLTKKQRAGIAMLARTGIAVTDYTDAQVNEFLQDSTKLVAEIRRLEANVKNNAGNLSREILYQSEALGDFLVTGINQSEIGLALNADQIIDMTWLPTKGRLSAQKAALMPDVQALISLQAIKYMGTKEKMPLQEVANQELGRGTENGIKFVLGLQKMLNKHALDNLFKGNPALMQHGYLPEVVDPRVHIVFASPTVNKTAQEVAEMYQKAGYRNYGDLQQDTSDSTAKRIMLVNENVPETRRITGLFSFIDKSAKGWEIHDGDRSGFAASYNQQANQAVEKQIQNRYKNLRGSGFSYKNNSGRSYLIPVVNESGQPVNHRYEASHEFRNEALYRNNDFSYLFAKMHATTAEKMSVPENNKMVLTALKELYDVDFKGKSADYLYVGPNSKVKEYREAYALLPYQTRQDLEAIWGEKGMFVRKDMLDMVFGYKRVTLGDSMLKSKSEQALFTKGVNKIYEFVLARNGSADEKQAARIRGANQMKLLQRYSLEGVQEIKDIIVLRTGVVLLGNEMSNMSMLYLKGMGFLEAAAEKAKGLEALNVFRAQATELAELELLIETGTNASQHGEYRKRIGFLEESMNKNPVRPLIDAGFMPSIIEDVDTESKDYSYKQELFGKLEEKADKFGKLGSYGKDAVKFMYMSQDGNLHKFMRYSTQVSDFTARFALYQHLLKDKGMTEDQRFRELADSFVVYDIPSHRTLEMLNEVGLVMFTKFILRIQKPLHEAIKAKPLRAMTLWAIGNWINGIETITDSQFTNRFYNPLKWGVLEYPAMLDETLIMEGALGTAGALIPGK